jgi:transcriptional regulator with XRE-family HTH domain
MPKRKTRKIPRPALNQEIRDARLAAKLTQRELADAIGVSQRFVCGLESGEKEPNVHHLIAICKATGHTVGIDQDTVLFAKILPPHPSATRGPWWGSSQT